MVPFVLAQWSEWHFHDLSRIAQVVLAVSTAIVMGGLTDKAANVAMVGTVLILGWSIPAGRWGVIEGLHIAVLAISAAMWGFRLGKKPERSLPFCIIGLPAIYVCLVLLPRWAALVFESLSFHPAEFFLGFENPRFFGHWVTLTLPLMIWMAQQGSSPIRISFKYGMWLLVVLWTAFLLASGTRGSWLALAVVAAVSPILGTGGIQLARGFMKAGILGSLCYLFMFVVFPWIALRDPSFAGVERIAEGAQLSRREELWSIAVRGIVERPFMGNGPMMFSSEWNSVGAHPHNIALQIGYEWGLLILVLLVGVLFRVGWKNVVACRKEVNSIRTALVVAISGALLQAQVDGILVMPFSQVLFAMLCAWLASLNCAGPQEVRALPEFKSRVLLLGCTAILGSLCLPELSDLHQWEEAARQMGSSDYLLPRFWVQGLIPSDPQPIFNRQ